MEVQVSSDKERPKSSSHTVLCLSVGADPRLSTLNGFKERMVSTMVMSVGGESLDS